MTLSETTIEKMRQEAWAVSKNAYCPYSKFSVGASVLTEGGKVFSGCNVENASFGMTICAERNAIFQAVAAGERKVVAVVIVASGDSASPPCGACRQVIHEFGPETTIVSFSENGDSIQYGIEELLPDAFGGDQLK